MLVIRPIQSGDLDALFGLSKETTFGLTTLPKDRDLLKRRIDESLSAFKRVYEDPKGEAYLFVLEDTDSKQLAGTTGIVSKVGGFEPFYAYRVETKVHESQTLDVRKEIRVLHLVAEHNGPCEIGSLFLSSGYRGHGAGRLLSISRFLFMAQYPGHFEPIVIAEMRGVIDEQGRSPFWDAVGIHFFDIEFPKADYLSMVNKKFIGELMPKHPIYVPVLSEAARKVIGEVHRNTEPALAILEKEGFKKTDLVDIFEAGPIVSCPLDQIRAVAQCIRAEIALLSEETIDSIQYVIGNTQREFRACIGHCEILGEGKLAVHKTVAQALNLKLGDPVCAVALRPDSSPPIQ